MSNDILNINDNIFFMLPNYSKKTISGQLLISILIAITIFLILAHALFTLIASSFELVSYNKARITARHLAQEKMETIRNLAYSDVGTVGGIPSGIIAQEENIVENGLNFLIKTQITFVDDPFDGVAPSDSSPEDYKRARIEISWEGVGKSRKNPILLITDIAANATTNVEGGSLVILVFDANSNPVPQADVTIVASGVSPAVNLTTKTDSDGKVILPGATPCVSCYRITVTKSGFSTDRTYSTSEVTNPLKPDVSLFENDITQVSFAIDTLGSINVASLDTRENGFSAKPSIAFRVHGNKTIGTDAYAQPVYKYDNSYTTDGSGNKILNNIEWDVYHIEMPPNPSYDISATSPLLPLYLNPGGTVNFDFAVSPHTANSLFVVVKDPSQNLIASASARLYNTTLGFDESKFTGLTGDPDSGQVLFQGLAEDSYQITATASGYTDFNGNFDVSGYTVGEVVLNPQ